MPEVPQYLVCVGLLLLSSMFAGLTLGLMTLDPVGLKIVMEAGPEPERTYARKIYPIRLYGNLLLCTLLLGNVIINNVLTVFLDQLVGGLIAIVASSAAIVLFAEIIPQSVFGRHRLWTGAHTTYLTWTFLFLLLPISWPIAKTLDLILGEELGVSYSRDELRQLLKETGVRSGLEHQEVNILRGALELTRTTVKDVMIPFREAVTVDASAILDHATISRLVKTGFSRIPVYEEQKHDIVGILFIRDLVGVALDWTPDTPPLQVRSVMRTSSGVVFFTNTTLGEAFSEFKIGRSHLAVVRRPPTANGSTNDLMSPIAGIVTINDVLEHIVQSKILGEDPSSSSATTEFTHQSYQSQAVYADERTALLDA